VSDKTNALFIRAESIAGKHTPSHLLPERPLHTKGKGEKRLWRRRACRKLIFAFFKRKLLDTPLDIFLIFFQDEFAGQSWLARSLEYAEILLR
jgi:hypothetical protein